MLRILALLAAMSLSLSVIAHDGGCSESKNELQCVIKSYPAIYQEKPEYFWKVLNHAREAAPSCTSIETTFLAMVNIVRQSMSRQDDARSLLRSLYTTEADIRPDQTGQQLTIRLHQPANRCTAISMQHLIEALNATETVFPGTDLRLVYELVA